MKKTLFSLFLCTILLLCGCGGSSPSGSVDTDVLHLAAIMEGNGYTTQYYATGDAALSAIAAETAANTKASLKGAVIGYLFVQDSSTGVCVAEVFVFECKEDAKVLYDYMLQTGRFTENESECRIDGTVVYMGYIKDLNLLEGSMPQ